jgi:signal transduction histidine kinase/DNA-binding response OmpR family regulator
MNSLDWSFTFSNPDSLPLQLDSTQRVTIKSSEIRTLFSLPNWKNYGWLSSRIFVDSTLAGEPLYLVYFTSNPIKVWLNDKLVLQAGNPSRFSEYEVLPLFNELAQKGIILPYGENQLKVEFSTHKSPLFFIDYQMSSLGLNLVLNDRFDEKLKTKRGILFGGTFLLLLLLLFIHVFLSYKSIEDYPVYVSLCTFFTLLNSFTTLSDTFFDWTFSYSPFFTLSFPISYILSFYFYLIAIRRILKLPTHHRYFTAPVVVLLIGTLLSVLLDFPFMFFYILVAVTLIFLLVSIVSFIQAYKTDSTQRMGILVGGLLITTLGALSYVLVYVLFGIRVENLFFLSILLSYSGIPVSLTLYVVQSYSDLFYSLEQKIKDRTEDLAKSIQFKNEFLSNMSHEFITPLTICKNVLHLTQQQNNPHPRQQQDFDLIEDNLNRLHTMVKQLLDLTQTDQHQLTLHKSTIKAVDFYKDITQSFQALLMAKNISLNTYWETSEVLLEADRERIRIILSNLLSNAIKFTPSGGSITIKTEIKDRRFYFSISDTGPGIPLGMEEVIFDRFHRIQQQTQDYVEGAGIGLELSRTLARMHGGDIQADSNQRHGALFHFYMPMLIQFEEESSVSEHSSTNLIEQWSPTEAQTFTLLLVEDNPDMQVTIRRILEPVGEVHTAENGAEALRLLKQIKPDIIITDLMMPVMNGNEFIKELSKNPHLASIPIVILTAKNLREEKTDLLKIGVIDYLTKPFNPEHFLLKIKNLLHLYQRRSIYSQLNLKENSAPDPSLKQQLTAYILEHIDDSGITIERMADHFFQSRRTLFRAIESETGMTPGEFIREIRLQKALELIQTKPNLRLDELAYAVGYKTSTGFRKAFYERFGFHPIKG